MRTVRLAFFASLAVCAASTAWAQYGLYGSPETLQFSPQPAAQVPPQIPSQPYPAQTSYYPTTAAAPVAQPAPTTPSIPYPSRPSRYALAPAATTYQPYQTASAYRYPAQTAATAAYQPYQPGAQYQYPGPIARATMGRIAAFQPATQMVPAAPQPVAPQLPGPQPMPTPSTAPAGIAPAGETPATTDAVAPAPVPQGTGMMSQMLAEQANCGAAYGCGPACTPALYGDACGANATCGGFCPWYGSISALIMGRTDGGNLWTSFQTTNLKEQGGNTNMHMDWQWGGEARFGRRFCAGCVPYALEATYWTTSSLTGYRSTSYAGDTVDTALDVDYITFDVGGVPLAANTWFKGAGEQTLSRRDEFHNIELNLIREQLAWACDSPWDIGWSVGVRYFRFQDSLVYDSIMPGHAAGDIYDAYLSDTITNNLLGVQFGFDAAYNIANGFRVFITPKVGIYNNYLDGTFQAQLGNHVTNGYSTPYGTYYPVHGTRNAVSFLTQIDLGAEWQFARNWSARGGYRVVAATGMGLAEDQFPQTITDVPELQSVQNSASLVLHGAFFGVTYNF